MNLLRIPILFVTLAIIAHAAPISATSTITAATVYADRAVVTRIAPVDLPAAESETPFAALPPRLPHNSTQVPGRGTAAAILDVTTRPAYVEPTADPRI